MTHGIPNRRTILVGGASFAASLFALDAGLAQQGLPPTPECKDGTAPTLRQTEGPFFTPMSPERADLVEAGMKGQQIELVGVVLSRACKPVPGALLDLWHADDAGEYDNKGYRLRGHQFADAEGRYRFRTIVPAQYPGRTPHFHIKVQPKGGRVLTTQLYFPDEPRNARDPIYRRELLMKVAKADTGPIARFDFVLDIR
jgi:protocatechuate 3,4-dioxygenase beta subunit